MLVAKRKLPSASDVRRTGAYLTDERRLYQVAGAVDGQVLLEDAKTFEAEWVPVKRLVGSSGYRLVR